MVTHPGAMNHLTLSDVSDAHLRQAKHLHFSSYFIQPGIKPDIVQLFKLAKDLGLTTSLDTQWDPAEKWDFDLNAVLPYVDVFLPNKIEALYLTGEESLDAALDKLATVGKHIVIKLGDKGSISKTADQIIKVPPFLNKNVVDAIGAGDSFNAGFIFKFIQGFDVRACQTFGNVTGAINTTQAGGTTAFKNMDSILQVAQERFGYAEAERG